MGLTLLPTIPTTEGSRAFQGATFAARGWHVSAQSSMLPEISCWKSPRSQSPILLIERTTMNPERHIDRSALPSGGEILRAVADPQLDSAEYDRERAERYARREGLY